MQAELQTRDEKSVPRCGRARLFRCYSGLASVLLACAVYGSGPARPAAAQSPPAGAPLDGSNSGEINFSLPGNNNADANSDQLDFFTGVVRRGNLLGDIGGLRSFLGRYGITVALTDVSDVLGNTSGGIDRGATYSALTALTLQMDTQKAFGWDGGLVNVSGLQIRGRNFSEFYLNNLQTVSGIEAENTTRLWEVWYQQTFADGAYDVKFGQQSIDQEFMASQGSALYLNTMMGWPMLPSANLYAGGPAYPLSSLGIRLRAHPTGALTLLAGVFQDNPPGGPFDDDGQLRGSTRWGGNFNLRTGALFIAEAQYAINQPANGEIDRGNAPTGLPFPTSATIRRAWRSRAPTATAFRGWTTITSASMASRIR
jgi:porin